jgi:hypothetical protein
LTAAYAKLGTNAGGILNGEKSANFLWFSRPTSNSSSTKTAKALGIAVPPTLLATADDVIE